MPNALPPSYSLDIARRYLGGETIKEIAASIGRSSTQVRYHIGKALTRALAPYTDPEGGVLIEGLETFPSPAFGPPLTAISEHREALGGVLRGTFRCLPFTRRRHEWVGVKASARDSYIHNLPERYGDFGWEVVGVSEGPGQGKVSVLLQNNVTLDAAAARRFLERRHKEELADRAYRARVYRENTRRARETEKAEKQRASKPIPNGKETAVAAPFRRMPPLRGAGMGR